MSDNFLYLVPADPHWQPAHEAVEAALALLAEIFSAADQIGAHCEDGIIFFDAGANTESISCPSCGSDLGAWWGNAMDDAYAVGFESLAVRTPCCQAKTSLNDLTYIWPAAFGSFALKVMNPGAFLSDEQRVALERVLGSPLRVVWQHI